MKAIEQPLYLGLIKHFIPALVSIFVFQVVAIEIYSSNPLSLSKFNFTAWTISQAIGSFLIGFLSDKFYRKDVFLATQCSGCLLLLMMIFFGYKHWITILLVGLTFSPTAVARAALIDYFHNISKVKLIGTTFIILLIPWCFYTQISKANPTDTSILLLIILLINVIATHVFFEKKPHGNQQINNDLFKSINKEKAFYTALAFLPGEIVFFLCDSFFEESAQNAQYFSALGIGVFIGAILSVFYTKTPHLSILTTCYGIGFLLSILTVTSNLIISIPNINLSTQIMLFSTLGGFYLPFVYDFILTSISSKFRGVTCGLIDSITSLSSFIGLSIILLFNPTQIEVLILMSFLYLAATVIQKRSESA